MIHAFIWQKGLCEMRYALGLRHYSHEDPRGVNAHRRQAELVRGEAQRSVL